VYGNRPCRPCARLKQAGTTSRITTLNGSLDQSRDKIEIGRPGDVAFAREPAVNITATPHPRYPGELIPFFDEAGRPYKERLEGEFASVRLVSELQETVQSASRVVIAVRQIAAARATVAEADISPAAFENPAAAERELLCAIRRELGLTSRIENPAAGG
jgi:hypothetical protein